VVENWALAEPTLTAHPYSILYLRKKERKKSKFEAL